MPEKKGGAKKQKKAVPKKKPKGPEAEEVVPHHSLKKPLPYAKGEKKHWTHVLSYKTMEVWVEFSKVTRELSFTEKKEGISNSTFITPTAQELGKVKAVEPSATHTLIISDNYAVIAPGWAQMLGNALMMEEKGGFSMSTEYRLKLSGEAQGDNLAAWAAADGRLYLLCSNGTLKYWDFVKSEYTGAQPMEIELPWKPKKGVKIFSKNGLLFIMEPGSSSLVALAQDKDGNWDVEEIELGMLLKQGFSLFDGGEGKFHIRVGGKVVEVKVPKKGAKEPLTKILADIIQGVGSEGKE